MGIDAKYHVNKVTGRAGICRATKKGCPLGEDTPHFPTKEGAQKFIEQNEAANNDKFTTIKKSKIQNIEMPFKNKEQEDYYNKLSKKDQAYYQKIYKDNPNFSDRHVVAANEVIIKNMSDNDRAWLRTHDTFGRECILDYMRNDNLNYQAAENKYIQSEYYSSS